MTPNERVVKTLSWDDQAREWLTTWSLTEREAEAIILSDKRPQLDPHSQEVGYPIARYRCGDVIVVVGFRDKAHPRVLHVAVNSPTRQQRSASSGGGCGTTGPTSTRDLKRRMLELGYRIELTGAHHMAAVDKDTGRRVYTFPATASDHRSVTNSWKGFLKAHAANQRRLEGGGVTS